jgi:hypothetical protein
MKKNKIIAPIVLVLLVAVGVVAWQKRSVRVPMRLELTGTKGLKVAGKVIVDGVPREFAGQLPTHITAGARNFEYTISMQESKGQLRGELTVANGIYGSSATADDYRGVKGAYSHTWGGKGGMMTTVEKRE